MLKPDGAPWFFVDARPVTAAEWAKGFPKLKAPKAAALDKPVINAPYNFAKAYAQTVGKRLHARLHLLDHAHGKGFVDPQNRALGVGDDHALLRLECGGGDAQFFFCVLALGDIPRHRHQTRQQKKPWS